MYFCVLTVEYIPVKVTLSLIAVLLHRVFEKTVGPFAIRVSCFECFICEEKKWGEKNDNSSLKSVFVQPFVGLLKCMLKKMSNFKKEKK